MTSNSAAVIQPVPALRWERPAARIRVGMRPPFGMARTRAWLNLGIFIALIAANGFAASGALSGASIGEIANRIPSLFLPANWVFGIWSLIYLGLASAMGYQLLSTDGAVRTRAQLGWWWLGSCALNVAWISLFSFEQFGAALLVMVALLGVLIVTADRLRHIGAGADLTPVERLCVRWPFDLYLAWISVALISNSFQFAHVVGFGGFGIPERVWSVSLMAVAALLGVMMAWTQGMWIFPFVVAWAVYGIGARYADDPLIGATANPLAVGAILMGLSAWWFGRRARRTGRALA